MGWVGFLCACLQVVLGWDVMTSSAPGLLRYVPAPPLTALPTLPPRWLLGLQSFPFLITFKLFFQKLFCGSLGINLSMGKNTGRGKVAYSWISPDPVKAGPTLGVVVVVVVNTMSTHGVYANLMG